jgi:hypothetical protein
MARFRLELSWWAWPLILSKRTVDWKLVSAYIFLVLLVLLFDLHHLVLKVGLLFRHLFIKNWRRSCVIGISFEVQLSFACVSLLVRGFSRAFDGWQAYIVSLERFLLICAFEVRNLRRWGVYTVLRRWLLVRSICHPSSVLVGWPSYLTCSLR